MNSCIKRIHHDLDEGELIEIALTNDNRLLLRKNEKVTSSGSLIVITRANGRKVVINPNNISFFYTKGAWE